MSGAARLDLNGAAAQVAAAFGLKIRFRETLEATSGRLDIVWTLEQLDASESGWTLELTCLPPAWGGGGWEGAAAVVRPFGERIMTQRLVVFDEGLSGRKAGVLTRARFCAWAARQTEGSLTHRLAGADELAPV